MQRRTFLAASVSAAISSPLFATVLRERTVAVIGHTGRGNYGHRLDEVWQKVPGAKIVGVADADEEGLQRAVERLGLDRGYSDYREMLVKEQPELVSVAPRHPDQHLDMALAAIESGAKGLYVEKPFCRSPAEADRLIQAAETHSTQIAVAHRNRYHPVLPIIQRLVSEDQIGRLLEIRGHGLGDRRGGSEDLWVLGGHIFNLFQYFAGDPISCSGLILKQGKPVTKHDIVDGAEGLGPLAGDQIHAHWLHESGLVSSYTTLANDGSNKKGYAAHLVGTKGTIGIYIDRDPLAWFHPGNPFDPGSRQAARVPITTAGLGQPESRPQLIAEVHNHVLAVRDLMEAVDQDRAPLCDARQGATAVEMTCGVFESHRQGGRHVSFPLKQRDNPFASF